MTGSRTRLVIVIEDFAEVVAGIDEGKTDLLAFDRHINDLQAPGQQEQQGIPRPPFITDIIPLGKTPANQGALYLLQGCRGKPLRNRDISRVGVSPTDFPGGGDCFRERSRRRH